MARVVATLAAVIGLSATALAAPSGPTVISGQATSTVGATTHVQQTSARAIINWQSFDVAPGESVVFSQPSASAVTLNRIASANASNISGNLTANGRIFIVNANGVVFGPSARVNTSGLVATNADIDNASFMQGRYEFRTPGTDGTQISNQGVITTTAGGRVALLGPHVQNTGSIVADRGVVVLSTGQIFLVDLFGDGLVQVASARIQGPPSLVTNSGNIQVGPGVVLVRSVPGFFQGTINSVNVANLASSAVLLPGGTVAFVGTPGNSVQPAYPNWLGPNLVPVGSQLQGGGIIDATPMYSFQSPATSAGVPVASLSVPGQIADAALAEFNRLPDRTVNAPNADRDAQGSLYTVAVRSGTPPVAEMDDWRSSPRRSAPRQQTNTNKRYCTVTELMHANSAQGCR